MAAFVRGAARTSRLAVPLAPANSLVVPSRLLRTTRSRFDQEKQQQQQAGSEKPGDGERGQIPGQQGQQDEAGDEWVSKHPSATSRSTLWAPPGTAEEPSAQRTDARGSAAGANDAAWHAALVTQLRAAVQRKRSDVEPRLKEQLAALGKRWNEYSGYEEVLEAKAEVLAAEVHLKELRDTQKDMRQEYMTAVSRRAASQRTLNELLVRKATWSEQDLATYTDLLKSEHSDARAEREATERYEAIGTAVNTSWDKVVKKTLERYHLEQVWSDRVRAGSTYGSLVVAGINVLIFALALLVFEPYKRRKLAQTFETRLLEGEEKNSAMLASVVDQFESRVAVVQEQGQHAEAALGLLLQQAGIRPDAVVGDGEDASRGEGGGNTEATEPPVHAPDATSPPAARQQHQHQQRGIQDRRREMGMAAAVGFAVGAGLLAAFGALQS